MASKLLPCMKIEFCDRDMLFVNEKYPSYSAELHTVNRTVYCGLFICDTALLTNSYEGLASSKCTGITDEIWDDVPQGFSYQPKLKFMLVRDYKNNTCHITTDRSVIRSLVSKGMLMPEHGHLVVGVTDSMLGTNLGSIYWYSLEESVDMLKLTSVPVLSIPKALADANERTLTKYHVPMKKMIKQLDILAAKMHHRNAIAYAPYPQVLPPPVGKLGFKHELGMRASTHGKGEPKYEPPFHPPWLDVCHAFAIDLSKKFSKKQVQEYLTGMGAYDVKAHADDKDSACMLLAHTYLELGDTPYGHPKDAAVRQLRDSILAAAY